MVFIVHGTSSLVNDQFKTVTEGVLSVAYHQHDERKFIQRENFENFITVAHPEFGKRGAQPGVWRWNPQPPETKGVWGRSP